MKPQWINRYNYKCVSHDPPRYVQRWPWIWQRTELMEYTADPVNPPTFMDERGDLWRFDNHLEETDGLSIPYVLQYISGVTSRSNEPNGPAHDSIYRTGGAWKWTLTEDDGMVRYIWRFVDLTQAQGDDMLRQMFDATDGRPWVGKYVKKGLDIGGFVAWNSHAKQREQEARKRLHK